MKNLFILAGALALASCALTIAPDGSKAVSIDGASIVEILATK